MRNDGEIPPGFLQEILRLIIENEKCVFYFTSTVYQKNNHQNYKVLPVFEPRYEKTGFLHMRKQRRRSASR